MTGNSTATATCAGFRRRDSLDEWTRRVWRIDTTAVRAADSPRDSGFRHRLAGQALAEFRNTFDYQYLTSPFATAIDHAPAGLLPGLSIRVTQFSIAC